MRWISVAGEGMELFLGNGFYECEPLWMKMTSKMLVSDHMGRRFSTLMAMMTTTAVASNMVQFTWFPFRGGWVGEVTLLWVLIDRIQSIMEKWAYW
jgi:hypothetical protein